MANMMESCFAGKLERVGPVEVNDIRRDLLSEFTALPAQEGATVQSENLQVYLRVRPFTVSERNSGESQECVTIEGPDTVVLKAQRSCQSNRQSDKSQTAQRFSFTQVFGPESSQRTVFEGSVRGLVRDVLEGGNCLVFTYGVTNAGKTFTFLGPAHDSGLLPRSLSVIFNSIEGRMYSRGDLKPQRCRDFSRLTPDQQVAECNSKKNLLRQFKESDKNLTSGRSTFLEGSSLSTDSSLNSVSDNDSFCLDVGSNVRFSVWVSFCEIYNDNIHDLLEQVGGHHKRAVLRLSQDVKGNSFIKDLRWVQVDSAEEAYRVMKIGKKNQSFSSTRLNHLSSRSHSIFSIRILRVDDVGVPRILGISELSLCDLAGSERCSRTHNTGERLKEAGNINTSLMTLGKCIKVMRLNQHAKFQKHVPFRESKLTHLLQFFFCGAGRVSMVVNINQSTTSFDETLNVLKFSALAQKVVVLTSRPVVPEDEAPHRSAMELSLIIDEADRRRNVSGRGRKSSMVAWETTLEDVLEDEDDEEEEEESMMEGTVLEAGGEEDEEEQKSSQQAALRLVQEAQIREEVSAEFMELFNKMEKDYSDRLEKEREILEERAEKRVEILKNLVNKTVDLSAADDSTKEVALLEGIISSMTGDLEKIREDAQSVHSCLTGHSTVALEEEIWRLQEVKKNNEETIAQLREWEAGQRRREEELRRREEQLEEVKKNNEETIAQLREREAGQRRREEELRRREEQLEEVKKNYEETIAQLREWESGQRRREEELRRREEQLEEVKKNNEETIAQLREWEAGQRRREEVLRRREEVKKEQKVSDLEACPNCVSVLSSLELEQRETSRLSKENKALVNGMFTLQTQVTSVQTQLTERTHRCDSLSEQLAPAESRLQQLQSQSEERNKTIISLREERDKLRHEVQEGRGISTFHAVIEELKKESEAALERSADKSQQLQHLQEALIHSESRCAELTEELANQRAEFSRLRAALESEGGALRGQLEGMERSQEEKRTDERRELQQKEKQALPVVEELKEEMHRLQERRRRREEEEENEGGRSREYEAVKRELERLQRENTTRDVPVSPLRTNMEDTKKSNRTTGRKRKSCEVKGLVFSENKRNRGKAKTGTKTQSSPAVKDKRDGALQKIGDMLQSSPSILSSKAKTIMGLVSGHSVDGENVPTATKPRRGRRKLYKMDASSPLFDSPTMTTGGAEDEKESDHVIIRRQLRSKTCRK
ncbi:kinesin-like protein KIF20B isoform X2 [Solea solea]|uniref:kinesin-like protein KIF20B isoform X2 n=2 Tax=Solea solea TaxID=90069 RepID=UPI00272B635A|nr:kinesin-like protein KIF20B isoform X2 [Solea solea]